MAVDDFADEFFVPCSDGACIIERPKGMHTNGGCRHLRHLARLDVDRMRALLLIALRDRLDLQQGRTAIVEDLQRGRVTRATARIRGEHTAEKERE